MKSYCLLILFCLTGHLMAQEPECFALHTNQDVYVSGETIWYKVHLLQKSLSSRIIHVDLLDLKGQVIEHQQHLIDSPLAGEIEIPTDLSSGQYSLRVYTQWNLNYGPQFQYLRKLPIYGINDRTALYRYPHQRSTRRSEDSLQIAIRMISTPTVGGKGLVQIALSDQEGRSVRANLSVSIAAESLQAEGHSDVVGHKGQHRRLPAGKPSGLFPPEKKLFLRGTAYEAERWKELETSYLSIWDVEKVKNTWRKTGTDGRFEMPLEDFNGSRVMQIHDFELFHNPEARIALDEASARWPWTEQEQGQGRADLVIDRMVNEARMRKQFRKVFSMVPQPERVVLDSLISPFKPDKLYNLNKYITFESLEAFVSDGIPWARITKMDNGNLSLRIANYETKQPYMFPPLYLIDHHIAIDEDRLLKMEWKKLSRIEQFFKTRTLEKQWGALGRNGIMSLYTRAINGRNYASVSNTFDIEGFHEAKAFAPKLAPNPGKDPLPVLRPVIHWDPDLQTDASGQVQLDFTHTNAVGDFVIRVQGTDANGRPCGGVARYTINPTKSK
ncbi:MAG: hypothetical protein AAF206_21540, partial [Bacteroidota bacterium]